MDIYSEISYKTSRLITVGYSTSFSMAVSFLPNETRQAIYSIYGFVRLADEIVDTFSSSDQALLLQNFERDYFEALKNRISLNPVLNSFILTLHRYNIPLHLVDSFLRSMKADLKIKSYADQGKLDGYIYGSADVVGLMCLRVFVNGDEHLCNLLEKPAMKLGSAFQKVNFLRDLKADIEHLDRNYFPDVNISTFDEPKKKALIENIEEDFRDANKGIKRLPGKSRLAVLIASTYYQHLLRKIARTPAKDILAKRIRLGNHIKFLLIFKAFFIYYSGTVTIRSEGGRKTGHPVERNYSKRPPGSKESIANEKSY
jgi:15-cis-phytoene synthase